jgi:hypothetical protein
MLYRCPYPFDQLTIPYREHYLTQSRWRQLARMSTYVGIMVATRRERKHVLRKYKLDSSTNLKLFSFMPSGIKWNRKRVVGLQRVNRKWVVREFPFPKVVYNRYYQSSPGISGRLEQSIGPAKCFNLINHLNKLSVFTYLCEELVQHIPVTIPYSREEAFNQSQEHQIIYLKPVLGNKGIGVYRVEKKPSGAYHLGSHYHLPAICVESPDLFMNIMDELTGSVPYLVQQGISILDWNGHTFDIRVLVQKNGKGQWSTAKAISRVAYNGSFNTSICESVCDTNHILNQLFPPDRAAEIMQTIQGVCLQAAGIIEAKSGTHMGEYGVDLVLDHAGQVWIIEVNGKPQKDLYEDLGKDNIVYKRPIEYARYLCRKRQ